MLDGLGRTYEMIFTNDGSADRSLELLRAQHAARPDVTRVIDFNANYGQHMAIMAAFERVRGAAIVTLDADLQNPPEEIPKLLAPIDAGHDYVGGFRLNRQDSLFRTWASKLINLVRSRTTNIEMTDQGCMLRAYRRAVIDAVVRQRRHQHLHPALAYSFAGNPAEVGVRHEERHAGVSNYSFYKLVRLNFDLITGFTLAPCSCSPCSAWLLGRQPGPGGAAALPPFVLDLDRETFGVFTLLGDRDLSHQRRMIGIGLDWRIHWPHLPGGPHRQRYHVREMLETKR